MRHTKTALFITMSALALCGPALSQEKVRTPAFKVDPPDGGTWNMFPHIDRQWMLETDPNTADGTCSRIASLARRLAQQMSGGATADQLLKALEGNKPADRNDPLEKLNAQTGRINESLISNVWNNYKTGQLRGLTNDQVFSAYDTWCKATYSRVTQ